MNFEKFKARTDLLIKKAKETGDGLPTIVAMERCSAIKEFLDDSYEGVLVEGERNYIESNMEAGMNRMIKDVLNAATKDPELFDEMMSALFGMDDEEGGDI